MEAEIVMTADEKIEILKSVFRQISNHDVLSWKPVLGGYQWTCTSHTAAIGFSNEMLSNLDLLGAKRSQFPYYFEPEDGATVVFSPIADDSTDE